MTKSRKDVMVMKSTEKKSRWSSGPDLEASSLNVKENFIQFLITLDDRRYPLGVNFLYKVDMKT